MTCAEVSGKTKDFVEDRLKPIEVLRYIRHIDGCEACRKEAETYFLLDRVRQSLDEDARTADYDFRGAFEKDLVKKKHTLNMIFFLRALTIFILLAAASFLVWLFFFSRYF